MFDKRLLQLVPGIGKLIAGKVALLWLTLLSNVAFAILLVSVLEQLLFFVDLEKAATPSPIFQLLPFGGFCVVALDSGAADFRCSAVNSGSILAYLLAFVVIALIRYAATRGATHLGFLAAERVKLALRTDLYRKMLALGPSYSSKVRTAGVVQLAGEGVEQVQSFFELFLPQLFYAVLAPLTLFVVVLPLNVPAAVMLLLCAPLIVLIVGAVAMSAARMFKQYWGKYTDLGVEFLDDLQGLETLKNFDADERAHRAMNQRAEEFRVMTMKVLQIQLRSLTAMDVVAYGGAAAGVIVTVVQYLGGNVGSGLAGCLLIVLLSADFFIPLRQLGSYFHVAMNGMTSSKKIFAVLDLPEPQHGTIELPRFAGDADAVVNGVNEETSVHGGALVCFRDVTFAYDDVADDVAADVTSGDAENDSALDRQQDSRNASKLQHQALHKVTFTASADQLTAIVGISGSGKSTTANLLAGRITGYQGSITIDGVELRDLSLDSLLRAVTVIAASSHMFQTSLRDNLLMAKPDASEDDLWRALEQARIADWVRDQPQGLDLPIAESGGNLSGGQRQRLALARGLLHDSPIYVFDEATSNIDAESESLILDAIRELSHRRTVLMITHRMANAVAADAVVVFDSGKVVEAGSHAELLTRHGRYEELFRVQGVVEAVGARHGDGGEPVARDLYLRADDLSDRDTKSAETSVNCVSQQHSNSKADGDGDSGVVERLSKSLQPLQSKRSSQLRQSQIGTLPLIRRLLHEASPLSSRMIAATIFGTVGHMSAALLPVFGVLGLFAASGHPVWGMNVPAAFAVVIVCAALRGVMRYTEQYMNHNVAFRLLALFRDKAFAALRRLAPARLARRGSGELIALVTTDVELLEIFFAHTISPVAIAVLTTLLFSVVLAALNPWMIVVLIASHLTVGVLIPWLFARGVAGIGPVIRQRSAQLDDYVLDGLRGMDETIHFNQGCCRISQIEQRTRALWAERAKLSRVNGIFAGLGGVLVQVFTIAAAAVAIALAVADSLTIPQIVAAVVLIASSFGPTLALSALPANLTQTFAAARRLFALMDESPAVEEHGSLQPSYRGMCLRNVTFAYAGSDIDEAILQNMNLDVPSNGVLGVQGPSGTGKSTLLKLLMRYWDPQRGMVAFSADHDAVRGSSSSSATSNDVALPLVDAHYRRRVQAMMAQDTYLFDGSIRSNLLIAKPDATDAEVRDALARASVMDFVDSLPDGLDTSVGELGDRLSEGERQRIGLVRVFLRDADLVLFDEPTSRLDALNEAIILQSIDRLAHDDSPAGSKKPAVMLVSHRQSAMRIADCVLTTK